MLCHNQIKTFQNIFGSVKKKLVVEEHKGELSLLLRSACSLVSQFGTIEEHFLQLREILRKKTTGGTKDKKCVCTTLCL